MPALAGSPFRPAVYRPSGRLTTDRLDGMLRAMVKTDTDEQRNLLLDAAERVVACKGLGCLTLGAVAAEAGFSKGGLLHHFSSKDKLIEALVMRSAEGWRGCYTSGYEEAEPGPGRMVRGILGHCLADAESWTKDLQSSSSACFAALAQNPELIQPMRDAYNELLERVENDGLPPGVGAAIAAAVDGLWLYWVLGLADVNQDLVDRMRTALNNILDDAIASSGNTDNHSEGDPS